MIFMPMKVDVFYVVGSIEECTVGAYQCTLYISSCNKTGGKTVKADSVY